MALRIGVTAALVVGLAVGCLLELPNSTGCRDSDDCLGARVCIDGSCADDPCAQLCDRYCQLRDACAASFGGDDCLASCADPMASMRVLPVLSDATCHDAYDELTATECDMLPCREYCAGFCARAADCALADAADACFAGCIVMASNCGRAVPTSCVQVSVTELGCYVEGSGCG